MSFTLRCRTLAALLQILIVLNALPTNAFLQTTSLLVWSTAPGASLEGFLNTKPQEETIVAPSSQLSFGISSATRLCPLGLSSLIIFTLDSHSQQLKNGFLSRQINKDYNSVPGSARVWIKNSPKLSNAQFSSQLLSSWKTTCVGEVVVKQIQIDDDIESIFSQTVSTITGPRLMIFTTSPFEEISLMRRRQLSGHPPNMLGDSNVPSSKTGVLWRYNFLSEYLIIGVLVMFLLFIPPIALGSFALLSIETPKGLKTKMIGQISEAKAN
ncbi:hypothetical protein O181_015949 [Austropuccinia psidii MF-1]|uniref:Protein BIG1 n=1 Tax=Austropuccinia psidii MF-1 TaxID=1389203 RepID=A0A9Q3C0T3_9BASI|nr:hypothetical protein [Austropuccinia psidii MF-1]